MLHFDNAKQALGDTCTKGGAGQAAPLRVLVFSAGGSPTAKQRKLIHDMMPTEGPGVLTAVVIGLLAGRAVVGGMALFNRQVRAFAPDKVRSAFEFLQLPAAPHRQLWAAVQTLHQRLGVALLATD